uniref:Kringle domain-containing protein n=1 Tax=Guillardia theta TaxID=55529 RepID=A0A7S4HAW5_GUITH
MARVYGTSEGVPRRREHGARNLAPVLAVAAGLLVAVYVAGGGRRRVELDTIPPAVQDLEKKIQMEDLKGWLNQAYENGQASKPLHPLGDLDPFTHEPMSADNPEAAVRNAKTKYIMNTVYQNAQQDMAKAQQDARDYVGTDAGCTHHDINQTDYAGQIADAVSGVTCMAWADASSMPYPFNETSPDVYPDLSQNFCRNPGAQKMAAWCWLSTLKTAIDNGQNVSDEEGVSWEYCDIGSRCGVDVPILHAVNRNQALSSPSLKKVTSLASRQTPASNSMQLAHKHKVLSTFLAPLPLPLLFH